MPAFFFRFSSEKVSAILRAPMPSPEELAPRNSDALLTLKDWSSSDKTLSEGKAQRVSAGSANQFQQFVTPDDGRKFTELYNVQHLQWSSRGRRDIDGKPGGSIRRRQIDQSAQLDRVSRVCRARSVSRSRFGQGISTIQRLYSMLHRSLQFLQEGHASDRRVF